MANTLIATESTRDNETRVKWVYHEFSSYPINLLTVTMNMDKIVGKDLEECLSDLKSILEGKKIDTGVNV